MNEIWKPVIGYEGFYEVSNLGHIRTLKKYSAYGYGYILNPKPTRRGYLRVTLRNRGQRRTTFIHVLVLEAFVSPRPEGTVANHKNCNKVDNCVENLEWITQRENVKHAIRNDHFFMPRGEQHGESKLTADQVRQIRHRYAQGDYTQQEIANDYSVSDVLISRIVNHKNWKHI